MGGVLSLFRSALLALLAGVCGWGAGRITRQSGADGSASPPSREAKTPDRAARLKALASTPAGGWMERARKATPAELEALWGEKETLFQAAGGVQEMAKRWLLTLWAATYLKGKEGMGMAAALFGEATRAGFEGVETAWRELPEGNLKTMALFNMLRMAPPERQPRVRALLDELPPGEAAKLRGQVSP